MICKTCGTEIADKAIICYRCGTSTFEPVRRPSARRRRRGSLLPSLLAFIVLVVAALLMGRATAVGVPQAVSIAVAALAAVVLAWQLFRRFRRR